MITSGDIRTWLRVVSCIWLAGCCCSAGTAGEPAPNIVVFLADDMGLGDSSAYQSFTGNADEVQIDTPNMERLARRGVRFFDAHAPSSRCSPTRYSLLTGRYAWRSRLKHWVLFGAQGDPLIQRDRPTLASALRSAGYRTYMVGKWHVGLRYRRSDGQAAAEWRDADLTQPMFDTPLEHGFDACRITSRSHGTSGPNAETGRAKKRKAANGARQSVGPGHIHDRRVMDASGDGKRLTGQGEHAYRLHDLGRWHSDHALSFLREHAGQGPCSDAPFFLYYASNSNHGPYTPDTHVGEQPVAGAARTKSGAPMNDRGDFVYENDVALGRLLDFLQQTPDARNQGRPMIDNTIVIFTSDNGAERREKVHTGPFRSHKGSAYEGGHRVPFLVSWPRGGVGDGDASSPGVGNDALLGLQDLYATLLAACGAAPRTDRNDERGRLRKGGLGGEDSVNLLAAWRGEQLPGRPMFFNDHKESADHAACAFRWDDPTVDGVVVPGQWKISR